MAERFTVDATNPGEVLACLGLAWLASHLDRAACTGFERVGGQSQFQVPFPTQRLAHLVQQPVSDAGDHLRLADLRLDWWREQSGLNPGMRFWAGQQSARSVLRNLLAAGADCDPRDWLDASATTGGRLGVDPMGSWRAIEIGWSINEHNSIQMQCRPLVEALAFLALQVAPVQSGAAGGIRYCLWHPCRLPLARLAFAGEGRHALTGYTAGKEKSGSNTILTPATAD